MQPANWIGESYCDGDDLEDEDFHEEAFVYGDIDGVCNALQDGNTIEVIVGPDGNVIHRSRKVTDEDMTICTVC